MEVTIIKPKSREEWLEYRKNGIGSSEVATVLGLNPYETPYQLWRRKLGIDSQKEENFLMKAGHYLEDAVARFWADETGREVIKSSAGDWLVQDKARPFLQVSPDRTYWLDESRTKDNKGILECKTTQKSIDENDLPKNWFCQVQYQLGVAGMRQGSIAWLMQGRSFGYQDITFVPEFFGWVVEEVEKFWWDNIVGKKEPEAVNVSDIMLKYDRHVDGKTEEVDDVVFGAYSKLIDVRDKISELEAKKEELEGKLKMAFKDAEALAYNGRMLATWKSDNGRKKFDAKRYQAEHPDLVEGYMVEVAGTRRFCVK